jgi:CHAT domain-containing protein
MAPTRAILVTNWSVHSQSARELVTDLFARQSKDGKLSRGEALRKAMMALLDGKGFTDGKGRRRSPMRTRCFGLLIRLSAMAGDVRYLHLADRECSKKYFRRPEMLHHDGHVSSF